MRKINNQPILTGTFKTNDWILQDFKGFSFKRANKGKAKHKFFVMLNPYEPITECGLIPKNLKLNDLIKDQDGIILKVVDSGNAGYFGKENFSWEWVGFWTVNTKFKD